ncbi:MAG: cell wall anchor protein, partial [Alistipes sp.]|nr:cell wall anchor protein [Alistipes sp.]
MKKTIIMSIVAAMALQLSTACTDYLYDGTVDLTVVEQPFDYPENYEFNHPCALVTQDDIDRVKSHVEAADETDAVYASWKHLCDNTYARIPYTPNPQKILVRGDATGTGVAGENYINACRDAAAAFQLALRWHISGDAQYADAAVNVLNQWADVCEQITANDNNQFLLAGFQGYQFANAAELLR